MNSTQRSSNVHQTLHKSRAAVQTAENKIIYFSPINPNQSINQTCSSFHATAVECTTLSAHQKSDKHKTVNNSKFLSHRFLDKGLFKVNISYNVRLRIQQTFKSNKMNRICSCQWFQWSAITLNVTHVACTYFSGT